MNLVFPTGHERENGDRTFLTERSSRVPFAAMARRLTQRGKERRDQLMAFAAARFAEQGYHPTSVSEIVAGLGVGKGVFYWYFQSKEELLTELLKSSNHELRKRQQLAIGDQPLSYEPYGLMLKRGDAPFRLAVNRILSQIYRSGEIAQIYSRWFGKLGPPGTLLLLMYGLNAIPE